MSTKIEKLNELLQENADYVLVSPFVVRRNDKYYKASIVSTNRGNDYQGFQLTEIPNPKLGDDEKAEFIITKYGDKAVYDGFISGLVIENQQNARKLSNGSVPAFEMLKAWNMFAGDGLVEVVKTGNKERILEFLKEEWVEHFAVEDDGPKLFL